MTRPINGLHHVTAIASDPQRNLDFYAGVLGLRLVKRTVNFDDPGTYHFYFGNELGEPGTLLTFFPWPGARRGIAGAGQIRRTALSVPQEALGFWRDRLRSQNVDVEPVTHGDGELLRLRDPDGLELELVADPAAAQLPATHSGPVPEEAAIRSLFGVTLVEADLERTARQLEETLGFRHLGDTAGGVRYSAGGEHGRVVELRAASEGPGRIAAGSVHHVAFRVPDDATQQAWRGKVADAGLSVTPVIDRNYFHSIYFREPGGVLFEIATDPPGFTVDEPAAELGTTLRLPPQYESRRSQIEATLPAVTLPAEAALLGPES
jgi:glyoxalase family protein